MRHFFEENNLNLSYINLMEFTTILSFTCLVAATISLWIKNELKIWGLLLCLSILFGLIAGLITWSGLGILAGIFLLWVVYMNNPNASIFLSIVAIGVGYKLKLLPGFPPYFVTPKFAIGLINPIIGLLPLALIVPLANDLNDWKSVLKGAAIGCIGIALIALLAVTSGAIRFNFKIPPYISLLTFSNLFLTCIPEEAFYRGFIQNKLCKYLKNVKFGKTLSLVLTAALFSFAHIYWSPNIGILALTFVAGLLYGGVYLYSKRIESAIFCHFLLNLIHITSFS